MVPKPNPEKNVSSDAPKAAIITGKISMHAKMYNLMQIKTEGSNLLQADPPVKHPLRSRHKNLILKRHICMVRHKQPKVLDHMTCFYDESI